MGEKLLKYYQYITSEKGIQGKMALAMSTKIPVPIAATEPDSEENIKSFMKAVHNLTGKPAPEF